MIYIVELGFLSNVVLVTHFAVYVFVRYVYALGMRIVELNSTSDSLVIWYIFNMAVILMLGISLIAHVSCTVNINNFLLVHGSLVTSKNS